MTDRVSWTVPSDHPAFPGHFPGAPILPGVVLLDRVLQHWVDRGDGVAGYEILSAKFLSPVRPGETLQLDCAPTASGQLRFDIHAGDRKVATGVIAPGTPA